MAHLQQLSSYLVCCCRGTDSCQSLLWAPSMKQGVCLHSALWNESSSELELKNTFKSASIMLPKVLEINNMLMNEKNIFIKKIPATNQHVLAWRLCVSYMKPRNTTKSATTYESKWRNGRNEWMDGWRDREKEDSFPQPWEQHIKQVSMALSSASVCLRSKQHEKGFKKKVQI